MDFPAETLRAWIEENWTLEDEGVQDDQVHFELVDINTGSYQAPYVYVYLLGFRRLQEAEDSLYEFTFLVGVCLWSKTKAKTDTAHTLHWKMVEHIKAMFDGDKCPDGWEWAHVDTCANAGLTNNCLPEENLINLTVKACIAWT